MVDLTDVTDNELWQELRQRLGHDGLVKVAKSIIEEDDAQRRIDDFFERHSATGKVEKMGEFEMGEFEKLADEWERGTSHFSSTRSMTRHSAFQKLVDLGPDIVPLAMERLKKDLGIFWFLVLKELVNNPPDMAVDGDMAEMRRRWVKWEKANK